MCYRREARAGGFTLVEIMVVVVIVGLLATAVTINVRNYLVRAKQNAARADLAVISQALDSFWAVYNRYPTNDEGLRILTQPTEKMSEALLKSMPVDPWGRPYQYVSPGSKGPFEVVCLGADGRDGGEGADADLTSEDMGR